MTYYYISEADAERASRALNLNEASAEQRSFSEGNKYNIFLSHKHDEIKLVASIKLILESLNSKVYVDWEDASMPDRPNDETARRLKGKIRSLDKFIFLASNEAIKSKWCNWEIGYGDAYKYSADKIVIFPVTNQSGWNGSEYLSLYPRIEFMSTPGYQYYGNPNFGTYWVIYPDGRKISLRDWLKK